MQARRAGLVEGFTVDPTHPRTTTGVEASVRPA
ncbi:MAG: hypothetical protein ACI9AX_000075, partial [Polaromonas sp.]